MSEKKICSLCGRTGTLRVRFKLPDYNILECGACHLRTRSRVLNRLDIDKLYSDDYFCRLQKDYFSAGMLKPLEQSGRFEEFGMRLGLIESQLKTPKRRVLDVGCATGVFMVAAAKRGWQSWGVEVSKFASNIARKKFGLKVFTGELTKAKYKSNSFDTVNVCDVIEHVEDPRGLLREIKRVLIKSGLIFVQTTTVDSMLFQIAQWCYDVTGGKFYKLVLMAYPVHHANHFSRMTLRRLLEQEGFVIVRAENEEMTYRETSLPKLYLPLLYLLAAFSRLLGKTIEVSLLAQKQ